ncbi:MAG: DUF1343 domain-containing protein [Myxococcota bacterium]
MSTLTGLDLLREEGFARLRGQKLGLLAHPASIDRHLDHVLDLFVRARLDVRALFGPEHGITGEAQDMETVDEAEEARDARTGARVFSLYGSRVESLRPTEEMLKGLDLLVIDLQDVGARYYTFAATMGYALEAAAAFGVSVMVLDRPNPLGGRAVDVEGPAIDDGYRSFVGDYQMPIRHGLTLAEYARAVVSEKRLDVDLTIVPMKGWSRELGFEATGLPWVLPSPNMPTVETAWVYPGQCLLEGTNLSEGRGTTRPFELSGAPFLDPVQWADLARADAGPGLVLRPTYIRPTFHKWAKERCGAVQIHVTDRTVARPLQASIALLSAAKRLAPGAFEWRTKAYEFVSDRLAIDLLFGSDRPRRAIDAGAPVGDLVASFREDEQAFVERRRDWLLY